MKVLFIATRSPYPARDGGAVLMAATVEGLQSRGHVVTVVAPGAGSDGATIHLVDARPRLLATAFAASVLSGRPLSVERHAQPRVAAAVAGLIGRERFDVVHVEQPQAILQAAPAFERRLPVVLRAQNVESRLWSMLAEVRPGRRLIARRESRRLARWEAESMRRASVTLALTEPDANSLRALAPDADVRVVRMPMPAELPAAERELAGDPSVILLASGRWFPNRDGVSWFLGKVWPGIARALPTARLHVFGDGGSSPGSNVEFHPAPEDSRAAFSRASTLVVPLRIASGARVRILEAWARGVPVVASAEAASGLDVDDGEGLLVARTPEQFASGLTALRHPGQRARLVEQGRSVLRRWHDPASLALDLERIYVEVSGTSAGLAD